MSLKTIETIFLFSFLLKDVKTKLIKIPRHLQGEYNIEIVSTHTINI